MGAGARRYDVCVVNYQPIIRTQVPISMVASTSQPKYLLPIARHNVSYNLVQQLTTYTQSNGLFSRSPKTIHHAFQHFKRLYKV